MNNFKIFGLLPLLLLCLQFKGSAQEVLIIDTVYFDENIAQFTIIVPGADIKKVDYSKIIDCFTKQSDVRNNQTRLRFVNNNNTALKCPNSIINIDYQVESKIYNAEIYCINKNVSGAKKSDGTDANRCDLNLKMNNLNFNNIKTPEELKVAQKVQENTADEIRENQAKIKEIQERNKRLGMEQAEKEEKEKKEKLAAKKEFEKEQKAKEQKLAEAENKKKQTNEEISNLSNQVNELSKQIEVLKKENEKISSSKEEKSKKEKRKIEEANLANERKLDSMRNSMAAINSKISSEQNKLAAYVNEINTLKSENEVLTKETQSLKTLLEDQKAENQKLNEQLMALKLQTEKLLADYKLNEQLVMEASKKFEITPESEIQKKNGKADYNAKERELPEDYAGKGYLVEYNLPVQKLLLTGAIDESLFKYTTVENGVSLTLMNIYFDSQVSYFRFRLENKGDYLFHTGKAMLKGEFTSKPGTFQDILPYFYFPFPKLNPKSGNKIESKDFIYVTDKTLWLKGESDLYFKVKDRNSTGNIELEFPYEVYRKKLEEYENSEK